MAFTKNKLLAQDLLYRAGDQLASMEDELRMIVGLCAADGDTAMVEAIKDVTLHVLALADTCKMHAGAPRLTVVK